MTTFSGTLKGMDARPFLYAERNFVHVLVIAYLLITQWLNITNNC